MRECLRHFLYFTCWFDLCFVTLNTGKREEVLMQHFHCCLAFFCSAPSPRHNFYLIFSFNFSGISNIHVRRILNSTAWISECWRNLVYNHSSSILCYLSQLWMIKRKNYTIQIKVQSFVCMLNNCSMWMWLPLVTWTTFKSLH